MEGAAEASAEEGASAVQGKCTTQSVLTVANKHKSHSNLLETDLYIVEIVSKNTGNKRIGTTNN